jgi:ATP-dependent Lon protease
MKASNADLGALRANLIGYLDNEGKRLVIETGEDCKPTAAFQRAVQRAELHAKDLGAASVTGANLLLGIFPETRSFAVGLLGRLGVFRQDAANFVARGAGKAGGGGVDASKVKK